MSNESIQHHLNTPADPAAFDKPNAHDCVKTRRKSQTPRLKKLPVIDAGMYAIRDRYQSELCNKDAGYARWLAHLVFRYQPKENGTARLQTFRRGCYWWEHSLDHYAAECDCSIKQVRGYIRKAKAAHLVDSHAWESFDGQYAGKVVLHIRLLCADGCPSLNGYPEPSQMRMVPGCPFGIPLSVAPEGIPKDLKEEALKKEGKAVSKKPLTPPGFPAKQQGTTKPQKPTPNTLAMYGLWEQGVKKNFPEYYLEPKVRDIKNLPSAMRRVFKSGVAYLDFLKWITSAEGFNQVRFQWEGIWNGSINKLATPPHWPALSFLLNEKNLMVSVEIYRYVTGNVEEAEPVSTTPKKPIKKCTATSHKAVVQPAPASVPVVASVEPAVCGSDPSPVEVAPAPDEIVPESAQQDYLFAIQWTAKHPPTIKAAPKTPPLLNVPKWKPQSAKEA